jgi:hypothetical protein
VYVDENSYYAEIIKGDILIKEGEIQKPDVTLTTSSEEVFNIIKDNNYAKESISSGKTNIEITKNYFVLFAKGYSSLYEEFSKEISL